MTWAGDRLTMLRLERENLIERWKTDRDSEKTKILVQIMDLEDDIAMVIKERKAKSLKNFH